MYMNSLVLVCRDSRVFAVPKSQPDRRKEEDGRPCSEADSSSDDKNGVNSLNSQHPTYSENSNGYGYGFKLGLHRSPSSLALV